MSTPPPLFPDFSQNRLAVNRITVNAVHGGAGPPALLLHGFPQTHVMWHRVAPRLAERFTVVCRTFATTATAASYPRMPAKSRTPSG
jgi:pimeloyl-ACP methyl ester carboxylesterase